MSDALTTITKLIQSPPRSLATGAVLFGIVWGFFKGVESVLTENTKLEIAVWLVGMKPLGPKAQPWPDTFAKVFDRVFGKKHISWRCFWRSALASSLVYVVVLLISFWISGSAFPSRNRAAYVMLFLLIAGSVAFDYASLLETRLVLALMRRFRSSAVWFAFLVLDLGCTLVTSVMAYVMWGRLLEVIAYEWVGDWSFGFVEIVIRAYLGYLVLYLHHLGFAVVPSLTDTNGNILLPYYASGLVTSVWLWLYAGSGFLLKAARRFDIGFDWFNRKFDIEKKPLQSIGLVAGALVALVYWVAVIVSRVVG